MSLSSDIMNLKIESAKLGNAIDESLSWPEGDNESKLTIAYKLGHRDARHAASELACKVEDKAYPKQVYPLTADGFDAAIIGVGKRCGQPSLVAYSVEKCLRILEEQGMSEDEALEYFEFNVEGSWAGEGTPLWIWEADADEVAERLAWDDEETEEEGTGHA